MQMESKYMVGFVLAAALLASPAAAQSKKASAKAEPAAEAATDDQASWGVDFSMGGLLGPASDIGNSVPLPTWNSPFAATNPTPAPPAQINIDRFAYLGLRYRLSDSMWFRGGLSLGFGSDTNDGKAGNIEEETYDSGFQLGLEPGVEMEIARRGRVSAVAGGFLPIGFAKGSEGYEGKVGNVTSTQDVSLSSFWVGVAPMIGGQIDIIDGFTVGAEYRLLLAYATKSGSIETKTGNTTRSTEFGGGAFVLRPAVFSILASFRF